MNCPEPNCERCEELERALALRLAQDEKLVCIYCGGTFPRCPFAARAHSLACKLHPVHQIVAINQQLVSLCGQLEIALRATKRCFDTGILQKGLGFVSEFNLAATEHLVNLAVDRMNRECKVIADENERFVEESRPPSAMGTGNVN